MRWVRFSRDRGAMPTAADGTPGVECGELRADGLHRGGERLSLDTVRLLPPCFPSKIVCVGRNYAEHARELDNEVPSQPLVFLKPPSSLIASGDPVVYPKISRRVDFEGELGVVIATRTRSIAAEDAAAHILGYTCVNDLTARDIQKGEGQWTRGKGFDTFCAVGPCVVTADELDFDALRVRTYVNGTLRQDGSVLDMLFSVGEILAFISECMTLEPGDLIATGTPPGVGSLQPGDTVRVEIPGVGVLENPVVRESERS